MSARADSVARYHRALRAIDEIDRLMIGGQMAYPRLEVHADWWHARLEEAAADYEAWQPDVALSRDPWTYEELVLPIDLEGLDGPWWNYFNPRRRLPASLPDGFAGLDGSVSVSGPVPGVPFAACPGPPVPTVMPGVLEAGDVAAVVSSLPLGPNTAYPVAYFVSPGAGRRPVLNEWGTGHFLGRVDGQMARLRGPDHERDSDLRPYLEAGTLRWIEPEDDTLTVREGAPGCPYLEIEGPVEPVWLVAGEAGGS